MKLNYIKPSIKCEKIELESMICQSKPLTGDPLNDIGSSTETGEAPGNSALSKHYSVWGDEDEED